MDSQQQPAFSPQPIDLERKLVDTFPDEGKRVAARFQLLRYGREGWHHEVDRVRLGILKLSEGDLGAIDRLVAAAIIDYRDILAQAEYPAYSRLTPGIDPASAPAQAAIAADKRQYDDWMDDG